MKAVTIIIMHFLVLQPAFSQDKLDVYYLSVGSGHYEQDAKKFREPGFIPYDNLPEANLSASIMSQILSRYAGAKGHNLTSEEKKPITKTRVVAAIDSIWSMIKKDKVQKPYFIFYYCGHGISENLAWNQFLIPGNYSYIPGTKGVDHLYKYLFYLGDLADKFDKSGIPYMMLIDCCRKEEADNSFPQKRMQYFFSEQNVETFRTVVSVVKYLNEFHQPNPVVFSITPGEVAPVVDIPEKQLVAAWSLDSSFQIGPVCRRILKMIPLLQAGSTISPPQLIKMITDPSWDVASPTSISNYEMESDKVKDLILLRSPGIRN